MNQPSEHLQEALYLMIKQNNLGGFQGLLMAGADPRHPDTEGNTILHQAIVHGHRDLLKSLLEEYSDLLLVENKTGLTPLNLAIAEQSLSLLDEILVKDSMLLAEGDTIQPLEQVNEEIPNPNAIPTFNIIEQLDQTLWPLAQAVELDWAEGVDRLIQAGACLTRVDEKGRTVLHLSAMEGKEKATEVLLKYDIDREIQDYEKKTALTLTKEAGYNPISKLLLSELGPTDRRFSEIEDKLLEQKRCFENTIHEQKKRLDQQATLLSEQMDLLASYKQELEEQKIKIEEYTRLRQYFSDHVSFFQPFPEYAIFNRIKGLSEGTFAGTYFLSPDSSILAAIGKKGGISVWDTQTGERWGKKIVPSRFSVFVAVAFISDGIVALSIDNAGCSGETNYIKVWNISIEGCVCTKQIPVSRERIDCATLSPDGKIALTGDRSGGNIYISKVLKVWDVETGECLEEHSESFDYKVSKITLSTDGSIALMNSSNCITVWDIKNSERLMKEKPRHIEKIVHIALSKDGTTAVIASQDTIEIWDVNRREFLEVFQGPNPITGLDISADGSIVGSGSSDKTIKIWDTKSGDCLRTIRGHQSIQELALSSDGSIVVGGGRNLTIWKTKKINQVQVQIDEGVIPELMEKEGCTIS